MAKKPQRPKDTNQLAKLIVDIPTGDKPKEQDKKPSTKKQRNKNIG